MCFRVWFHRVLQRNEKNRNREQVRSLSLGSDQSCTRMYICMLSQRCSNTPITASPSASMPSLDLLQASRTTSLCSKTSRRSFRSSGLCFFRSSGTCRHHPVGRVPVRSTDPAHGLLVHGRLLFTGIKPNLMECQSNLRSSSAKSWRRTIHMTVELRKLSMLKSYIIHIHLWVRSLW